MIILTLGSDKFVLSSLADAEAILPILNRATPLDSGYVEHDNYREVFYEKDHGTDLSISITPCTVITRAEFDRLKQLDAQAKAARTKALGPCTEVSGAAAL